MGTQITFRRGSNDPTSGSGITLAEPVFNTNLHTFHIGLGYGVTAEWVGAPISGLSADIAAGITYKIPTLAAVKNYVSSVGTITNYVTSFNGLTGAVQGVSAAVAGTGISVSGATGAVTITNTGVQSFNGATGAVTGASLGANTFTGTQTLTAGLTTSYMYASTGSTFGSTLQVNGGATFSGRVDVVGTFKAVNDAQFGDGNTDTLNVYSGTTFQNRTDFGGSNNFNSGLTAAGNINLSGTRSITGKGASLIIKGISTGASPVASNSIVLSGQVTTNLSLNSATGIVDIQKGQETVLGAYIGGLKIKSDDNDTLSGSSTITPQTYLTADRFLYVPDDTGTIALTKNVVSSFNGLTGTVQGVSAAVAGTGISVSGATGAVTITNTGVQTFNGLTGTVQGVSSFNGKTGAVSGASLGANTFTGLQTLTAGLSASGGVTLGGTLTVSGNAVANNGFSVNGGIALPDGGTIQVDTIHNYNIGNSLVIDSQGGGLFLSEINGGSIFIDCPNIVLGDVNNSAGVLGIGSGEVNFAVGFTPLRISGVSNISSTGTISTTGTISSYSLAGGNSGVTASIKVYTYPDGVTTSSSKTQYYQPTYSGGKDASGYTVQANRTYFSLFYTPVSRTIKSIRMEMESTGSTGSAYVGIYSADSSTGLPKTLLYTSASTTVPTSYSQFTVSSVNTTVPAGWFYLAVSCSLTPRLYGYGKQYMSSVFGSGGNSDGYQNYFPVADTTGFTLPSSLPATGITLAFVDYSPANYVGVRLEYGV